MPPVDAGPRSSAPIHGFSRDGSIAVLLDPKVAGPTLWDIVDKAKQAVDPLTHLIQALRHLDQPIFGFAKASDSGHYKQTDPYGFCGYLAFEQLSRKSETVYHPTCLNLAKVDDRDKFMKYYEGQQYMCDNSNAEIHTTKVINYLYNNPTTITCNESLYLSSDHIYKMKFTL